MSAVLLRLLVCSYGLAAAAGAAAFAAGAGPVAGVALFWFGGAALALALPLTPAGAWLIRRPEASRGAEPETDLGTAAAADDLLRWEEDRQSDAEEAARRAFETRRGLLDAG